MRPAQFCTQIFTGVYSQDASERVLLRWLEGITQQNVDFLREHPDTPRLYDSGVRYYHEGIVDEYYDIPECIHKNVGDCKSLSPWLAAEYRFRGVDPGAQCCIKYAITEDPDAGKLLLYHVQVKRSDGTIEDPSAKLGMNVDDIDGYQSVPGVELKVARGMTSMLGAAMLGNQLAVDQLKTLHQRALTGDKRAAYLVEVARLIDKKGYDPTKTQWKRLPDGSWNWTHPGT